jgi:hypothetical protein
MDNCKQTPNGPLLGMCYSWAGMEEETSCTSDGDCNDLPDSCGMNQDDAYPPQGNNIGDACDCEGDFDCDGDVDGTDATTFKLYFGRSPFNYSCNDLNPCNGDFDCDNDCDGSDASLFKEDFGRSSFNNPCPACEIGDWCVYE